MKKLFTIFVAYTLATIALQANPQDTVFFEDGSWTIVRESEDFIIPDSFNLNETDYSLKNYTFDFNGHELDFYDEYTDVSHYYYQLPFMIIKSIFNFDNEIMIHLHDNSIINLGEQVRLKNSFNNSFNKVSAQDLYKLYMFKTHASFYIMRIWNLKTEQFDTFIEINLP